MSLRRLPLMFGFNSVPRLAIRPENTVLLIQDMQNYFVDPKMGLGLRASSRGVERELNEYYEQMHEVKENIAALISAARLYGILCIYTRFAYQCCREITLLQKTLGVVMPESDPGASITCSIEPLPTDLVISKGGLSAFSNPQFQCELVARRIENILVCGLITDVGIRATAYGCLDSGYRPLIIGDGCAGSTKKNHYLAITEMTFGTLKVRSTGETLRHLQTLESDDVVLI